MTFWKTKFGRYVFNNLIALDQACNTISGGDPDETISSRIGKIKENFGGKIPWHRPVARVLDAGLERIQPGHCQNAIEPDEGKDALANKELQKKYTKDKATL
jgi:hypothetical protein